MIDNTCTHGYKGSDGCFSCELEEELVERDATIATLQDRCDSQQKHMDFMEENLDETGALLDKSIVRLTQYKSAIDEMVSARKALKKCQASSYGIKWTRATAKHIQAQFDVEALRDQTK